MTSLLRKMAAMTVMSTLAIAMPVLANPLNSSDGIGTKQRSSVLQNFGEVRGIGEFIVLRDSYTSRNQTTRQFEAIVDGSRQDWWVDCRRGQLGTDDWSAPRTSSTAEIITFVCNDRYTAGNSGSGTGSTISPNYGNVARVTRDTGVVSSNGRSLFALVEGAQIQVNWGDRRTINGREYVLATDSMGQTGYIRTDRIESRGPTGVTGRPIRPSGDRSETASVLRETPGVSSSGRELFYFFEGEQIRVNWGDRRTINGRDYVAAIDSVGQQGYIQVNQIGSSRPGTRPGTVTTRPTRPNREQWQRATVSRETAGLSDRGEELFYFYEGEQIQINRSAVLRIDGQDHVEALDSVGQRGYIRVDRVR